MKGKTALAGRSYCKYVILTSAVFPYCMSLPAFLECPSGWFLVAAVFKCVRVCSRICVRVCSRICVRVCSRICVRCVRVFGVFDVFEAVLERLFQQFRKTNVFENASVRERCSRTRVRAVFEPFVFESILDIYIYVYIYIYS